MSSLDLPSGSRSPPLLVGRDAELTVLHECFARSVVGSGCIVLVSGEAGIGKTSLVQTFLDTLASSDALILKGYCYDPSITSPYGLWIDVTGQYRSDGDHADFPELFRQRGTFGDFASQVTLFETVRDFFVSISKTRPLVLVLEDLHWADQASLELLRYLARRFVDQRVMIIASYRDDEVDRHHPLFVLLPSIMRETRAIRLELNVLDREQIVALVRSRWILAPREENRLVKYLMLHAEGHPLFTVELLRTLEQSQFLRESRDGCSLGDLRGVPVPSLVKQVIEGRLIHLSDRHRHFLEIASVIGQQVPLDVWQSVAGMDEDDLLSVVDESISLHVLQPSTLEGSLTFVHSLTREALYEGIVLPRRQRWHRRIAEMLASSFSPKPDVVAYHYVQADDYRAAEWLTHAGDHARSAWAGLSAVERYKEALSLFVKRGAPLLEQGWLLLKIGIWSRDFGSREALSYIEQAHAIAEQTGNKALRAMSLFHIGQNRFFLAESGLEQMRLGSSELNALSPAERQEIILNFPGYERSEFWETRASMAVIHSAYGLFGEAIEYAQEYLARADQRPMDRYENNSRGHAELALATSFAAKGEPEKAERHYARMVQRYREAGNDWLRAIAAVFHYQYCIAVYFLDDVEKRTRAVSEITQLWGNVSGVTTSLPPEFGRLLVMLNEGDWETARSIATPFSSREVVLHFIALSTLGIIARHQGDRDFAWKQVRTGLPEGPETAPGSLWHKFVPELQRLAVELAIDEGDFQYASRWLQAHDNWLEWSQRTYGRAESLLLRARLFFAQGEHVHAQESASAAFAVARKPRQPGALIGIHRFLGELALVNDNLESAESHLRRSLDLANACSSPFEHALTSLAQAEIEIRKQDSATARSLLADAHRICSELHARPVLERVNQLMRRFQRPRADDRFSLSRRELEVLQLLVEGMSDREIAEHLFISRHTVMRHVSSILHKLDVPSRTNAAIEAIRQRIV